MADLILLLIGLTLLAAVVMMVGIMIPSLAAFYALVRLIGWGMLATGAAAGAWTTFTTIRNSIMIRRMRLEEQKARARMARDPLNIAAQHAPAMKQAVAKALDSIEGFRSISHDSSIPLAIEAHTLVENRLPSLLERYLEASQGADAPELKRIAMSTLESAVAIGEVAEQARQAISQERIDALEIETRFVEGKTAPYARGGSLSPIR